MGQHLVAIIDDDPLVGRAVRRTLQSAGFEAETFDSGESFLASVEAYGSRHDCLVVDLQMPGMDGLQLQTRLAARGSRVPVIFITAHDTLEARERASAQKAASYLRKPLADDVLLRAVEAAYEGGDPPC